MNDNPADAAYYEHHANMLANVCHSVYRIPVDLDYLERAVSHAHAAGPVLDPTGYRDGMTNLRDMERLIAAMKEFRSEIEAVMA